MQFLCLVVGEVVGGVISVLISVREMIVPLRWLESRGVELILLAGGGERVSKSNQEEPYEETACNTWTTVPSSLPAP